ncbi:MULTISPECIES: hypothetical protein [Ralstonia solanacearum species complex]|uniref:Transmembrane protein n=1 Tax=Ralstonia syzygii TaxID=28097 RepID=A0ABX7ZLP9_9RALS|nr:MULTISPECIES: hypothetical protein [Ralstonia solanacearum species complex]QUP55809.1 hypothetical protein GO998_18865 [Ralstonia syzygii]
MQESLGELQARQLKALRVTAFKFLLPAAVISILWDGMDAWTSAQRGQFSLLAAQAASVVGTIFTIAGTGAAAIGFGNAFWMGAAALLGLVGAVLTIASVVAVLILSEDEWVAWLRDNPLNKERKARKPVHDDLKETLQKLSNAQAALT